MISTERKEGRAAVNIKDDEEEVHLCWFGGNMSVENYSPLL